MCALTVQELEMLDTLSAEFAAGQLVAGREECDEFPFKPLFEEALRKADEAGFFSLMLPEEMGGSGRSMRALCRVLRTVCRVDASLGGVIFTNALAQEVLLNAGADELAGVGGLVGFAPFDSPVETGNHAGARAEGGRFFLHGRVEYVTLGGLAGRILVPAMTGEHDDISFFIVDAKGEGVSISEPVISLGLHACPSADVDFKGAPASVIGQEGQGAVYLDQAADRMSVACAAMSAGLMRGSLETALDYARERKQGGRSILNWPQVRMMLADMAIKLESAELLAESASELVDDARDGWQHVSRATALHVCPMACDVASTGIQILGGNGYMHEYGQEKRFRDAQHIQMLLGMPNLRKLDYLNRAVEGN